MDPEITKDTALVASVLAEDGRACDRMICKVEGAAVEALLKRLDLLPTFKRPGLGLGEDLRFEDERMVGAALTHEGRLVHLSAFTKDTGARIR
jgi:hypothetical protein